MIKIHTFKYDDIEINFIKEGKGEPLVLIHGTNTKLQAWHYQIEFFKEKMMVIAFDNRGAGKSSRPDYPYTMDMYIEDTKNLLDHLNIQQKIHLCGISMGGMIAQEFVIKYPERVKTLILLATAAYIEPIQISQTFEVFNNFEKMEFEEKLQLIIPLIYTNAFKRKLRKDNDLYEKIKKDMNFIIYTEDSPQLKDYINQYKAVVNFNTLDSLHKITQPTLIAIGSKDVNVLPDGSKLLHERIPNSELKIFENLKHGFTIEEPEKLNELIWNFIKKYLG